MIPMVPREVGAVTTKSSRPRRLIPNTRYRSSTSAWRRSRTTVACRSRHAVSASWNDTPCFRRFARSLSGSHSYRSASYTTRTVRGGAHSSLIRDLAPARGSATRAVTGWPESCLVIADYRLFINRDLPLVERGCTSKAAFISRREARSRANHSARSNGRLAPYHCRTCDLWHLGHRRHGHG